MDRALDLIRPLRQEHGEPDSDRLPLILLFGMPRSGTTWIGKIFDSHPDTLYRHEPDSWGLLNAVPLMAPVEQADAYASPIREFCARLPGMKLTKVAASTPIFPKRYCSPLRHQLFRLNVVAAKAAAKLLGEQAVISPIRAGDIGRIRLVWKSIESLGRIGVVARTMQPCYGIHIARHPCGYVASVLRGESQRRFTGDVSASEDLGLLALCLDTPTARQHGLTLRSLKDMHPLERLAWRWVLYNAKAMQDIEGEPRCMTLRYEDICRDPAGVAKQLFDFTQLPWNAQTERFVNQSTAKDVGRYYSVVKDPLKASTKWKDELSKADIDRIYSVVAKTQPGLLYQGD
jgi:hypothetical protein